MIKRILKLIAVGVMTMNLYGCGFLLVGAGATGTALWLSDKLVTDLDNTFEEAIYAVKQSLAVHGLDITREIKKKNVAQIMSEYHDGKIIWIDINKMSATSSRIQIRVGITGDQAAAHKILDEILKHL